MGRALSQQALSWAVTGLLLSMMGHSPEERTFDQTLYSWVFVGGFQADFAFQLDQLSMVFVLLITTVGGLIHIYSLGYMSHDADKRKFFGYLNLFVAAMLILVLANNYLLLYVGWEGVGLASYLLISFWQFKPAAAAAGKKAFIINRVGDVGLSLAIMLMFVTFGSVGFQSGLGGLSRQSGSLNRCQMTSTRNPSTPRFSQKRSTSCIAATISARSAFCRTACSNIPRWKWCGTRCWKKSAVRHSPPASPM